jgi:hypothetical protein
MYAAEIFYPGTWLKIENKDIAFEIKSMLDCLVGLVAEASIALEMYIQAKDIKIDPNADSESDEAIRAEIDEQLKAEIGDVYGAQFFEYYLELNRRIRARKIELGIMPQSYLRKIPFIHAHSFLYAVDSFGKFLDEISANEAAPKELSVLSDEFNERLPAVRKIRNSALHLEDRLRRYASYTDKKMGKRMDVRGFLGLSNLENDDLCYTIDDGTYQRVSIKIETLKVLEDIASRTLAAFQWSGPQRFEP